MSDSEPILVSHPTSESSSVVLMNQVEDSANLANFNDDPPVIVGMGTCLLPYYCLAIYFATAY
jgi:hypothetical protein